MIFEACFGVGADPRSLPHAWFVVCNRQRDRNEVAPGVWSCAPSYLLRPAGITPGALGVTGEGSVNGIFLSVSNTSCAAMEGKGKER